MPHKTLHNKVVNSIYKLSWIPLPYNDVLESGKSTLQYSDALKEWDFGLFELEEQYHFLNSNQLCSSFLLNEFEIATHEPMHQIASIIGLISMHVYVNHSLSTIKPYAFHTPQTCFQILQYLITLVLIHIDIWRPIVKRCIPHILVDLGPIID